MLNGLVVGHLSSSCQELGHVCFPGVHVSMTNSGLGGFFFGKYLHKNIVLVIKLYWI